MQPTDYVVIGVLALIVAGCVWVELWVRKQSDK